VYLAVIPVIAPLYLDMVTVGILIQAQVVREMGVGEAFRMSVTVILIVFGQIRVMLVTEISPEVVVEGLREIICLPDVIVRLVAAEVVAEEDFQEIRVMREIRETPLLL